MEEMDARAEGRGGLMGKGEAGGGGEGAMLGISEVEIVLEIKLKILPHDVQLTTIVTLRRSSGNNK